MIEGIKETGYNTYTTAISQSTVQNSKETTSQIATFDLKNILEQIQEYTYTQEDTKQVESNLVNQLKNEFDLKEEEIYELHKRGFNLENLYMENGSSYISRSSGENEIDEAIATNNTVVSTIKAKSSDLSYKINTIKKENDNMYLNALNTTGPITIQSLYQNNYQGNFKATNTSYAKEDVVNVLQMNGMSATKGNMWAADKLMSYGMDVSQQQVTKLQNMKAAVAALEPEANLSEDQVLLDHDQMQYNPEDIGRITDDLGMVTDEHIEKLIEEGQEVNIDNLRQSIHENTKAALKDQNIGATSVDRAKSLEEESAISSEVQGSEVQGNEIATRDEVVSEIKAQINQIRAKLTAEAAQKISEKMPVESSQLSAIVQELNQMEKERVLAALQYVGLEANEANIASVTDVMETVETMKVYPMETVQIELRSDETATLKEINTALAAYAENETPTELRFGETINKVEGQIEDLLQAQGIEVSKETLQAAKALITNGLEVNSQNITAVLGTVTKINTFLEEMTPLQAASLIKEGLNPYYASVDTILSWVTEEKVDQLKMSVAETIVALEEKNQINEQQKEALIGLYRIMNGVSQHKEEVIGYLFKNELPLTVERLQEATKYIGSKNHIEIAVDDNFGELETLEYNKQTAKQLIEDNTQKAKKSADLVRMLEEMELPISESNITKLSKVSAMLYPYIKEQFKKQMGSFEGMSTLPESFLDKLEVVQKVAPEVVENMLDKKIPLTLSNIYWMDQISKEPHLYGQVLNEAGVLKEELPDDLEDFEAYLDELEEKAGQEQEDATLSGDLFKYRNYKKIEEATQFQRQLIEKEGLYQIPFVINGEQRMVNLYVHKDASRNTLDTSHFKAVITYATKNLGEVKAYVELKGDNIGYRVEGENGQATQQLKEHEASLVSLLSGIGYNVQYSEYINEGAQQEQPEKIAPKVGDSLFEEMI